MSKACKNVKTVKERVNNFTFMWLCIVTNLFVIKPNRCTNLTILSWNSTCFGQFVFLVLLVSWLQTVWHIPVPNVQLTNSWWRAEELPETRRGSFFSQNKCGKFVRLVVLLKKIVTMHGHMNVKNNLFSR